MVDFGSAGLQYSADNDDKLAIVFMIYMFKLAFQNIPVEYFFIKDFLNGAERALILQFVIDQVYTMNAKQILWLLHLTV